jgi:DNA-directed RNA polymerase I and III subunit RPAC1
MATESVFKNLATVDENPNMLTFQLTPTNVSYANTLRRMVLIGVESVAFNSTMNEKGETTHVVVKENTTPMTNEMLADRIGLIPVHADPTTWNEDDYSFELKIQNDTDSTMPVKAEHFDIIKRGEMYGGAENNEKKEGEEEVRSANVKVGNKQFFHPDPKTKDTCLIALLKGKQPSQAGQKIHLVAKASVGTGRDHIRFCPVSQCSYGYSVDTDEARQRMQFERWAKNSKNKSLENLKEDKALEETLMREFQTMEVQRCYKMDEATGEPNSFDFVIESVGVLPVTTIVESALENIEKKCVKYSALDKQAPDNVRVQNADARMKGFDFIFQKEDHTLGNLFQTYMEQTMMGKDISFVGYKVPHPLRDEMVIRVGVDFSGDIEKDGKETTARVAIAKAANECAAIFRKWREDWMQATSAGMGHRNLQSLRLTAENAKRTEQAADMALQTKSVAKNMKSKM